MKLIRLTNAYDKVVLVNWDNVFCCVRDEDCDLTLIKSTTGEHLHVQQSVQAIEEELESLYSDIAKTLSEGFDSLWTAFSDR